jgi:c-di-GMP-related signal transduction protein
VENKKENKKKVSLTHFGAHRFSVLMIERLSMSSLFAFRLETLSAIGTLRSITSSSRSVITIKEIQHKVYILAHDNFGFDKFPKHYLEQFYHNFTFHRLPFERENGFCATKQRKIFHPNMERRRVAIAEVETRKNIQFNTARGIDFFYFTRFGFYFCRLYLILLALF